MTPLLFEYNRNLAKPNIAQAARNICSVNGKGFIAERTPRKWFDRFKNNQFERSDSPRSGRLVEFDEERLEALLQEENPQTTRKLAEQLSCSPQTVLNHLDMGKVRKLGVWFPHLQRQNNKTQTVSVATSLLARHHLASQQHRPYLSLIVTGDEKWWL